MDIFHLNSQSYFVGDKVMVQKSSGDHFSAVVTKIRGCDIFMRMIDEAELLSEYKVFPVCN